MGELMVGDKKGSLILLILEYIIQNMLIPNMVSKVVYNFLIRSYEHFTFKNYTSQLKIKIISSGICSIFENLEANLK